MDFIAGATILLLACIGNAELWVVLINRRHSLRYRHHSLRRIRTFHDFGLLLFPPFILYTAGLGDNGLLAGGSISDLPRTVQGILLVTFLGLVPFGYSAVRWNLRRDPRRLQSVVGDTFDLAAEAKSADQRAAVLGQQGFLARLPFNQIYELEVNTRTLRLHSDQECERTLRIAHFSDMHLLPCPGPGFHERVVDHLCDLQPDFFVFTGDLLDRDDLLAEATELFRRMRTVAPGYFILGNHDWHLDVDQIRSQIAATGWTDVAATHITTEHQGMSILIAGTEYPWMGHNPAVPEPAGESFRLLLSHAPDQRNYAAANQYDLMVCGHNHGGQVVLPVVGPVYSPSRYGVQYAGGLFEYGNMLMHTVSAW